jgi:hypothetical protein
MLSKFVASIILAMLGNYTVNAQNIPQTIPFHQLPEILQKEYIKIKPELTSENHCAVAFTDERNSEKMVLECSFYTRSTAESDRRAMIYCDKKRMQKEISSSCKIIKD